MNNPIANVYKKPGESLQCLKDNRFVETKPKVNNSTNMNINFEISVVKGIRLKCFNQKKNFGQ